MATTKTKKQTKVSQTKAGKKADSLVKAKKPGKRTTAWGTTYTETRSNMSDVNPTAKKGKKL
jgi:hypothetical protein